MRTIIHYTLETIIWSLLVPAGLVLCAGIKESRHG